MEILGEGRHVIGNPNLVADGKLSSLISSARHHFAEAPAWIILPGEGEPVVGEFDEW